MLNAVNRSGTLGKRDYCILLILSELGLRRREVASLRKSSITKSADGRTLLNFTGKREQERCVPISRRLDLALGDYLGSNGQAQTSDDGPIFLNASHGRLSDSAIYDLVAKHALAAQIAKPVTPHSFRHFAITEAAEVEESTLSLRAFSGHRSVASLTRYTHINELRAIERIQMKRGIT
jgi:integrase/recombinase XerD